MKEMRFDPPPQPKEKAFPACYISLSTGEQLSTVDAPLTLTEIATRNAELLRAGSPELCIVDADQYRQNKATWGRRVINDRREIMVERLGRKRANEIFEAVGLWQS